MDLSKDEYKLIVESSPNMIWRAGLDGKCNYFNTTWINFTGRTMEQEVGDGWAEGVHPDDFDYCLKIYTDHFNMRKPFEMEYRLKRYDGSWRWINDRGTPVYNTKNKFVGFIGSCVDVTEKVEGSKLKEMAQKDGLTGVYNRNYFENIAKSELNKLKRYKSNSCIVMVDLNQFKRINDDHGHQCGDFVLKTFANTLKGNIREYDILGRYGGDEFVIMLPNTTKKEADLLIKRIHSATKDMTVNVNGTEIKLDASFGIGIMGKNDSFEKMLDKADKQMYRMKKTLNSKYSD